MIGELECPECGAFVGGDYVDPEGVLAMCPECDLTFDVPEGRPEQPNNDWMAPDDAESFESSPSGADGTSDDTESPEITVLQPDSISVEEFGSRLRIKRRWARWHHAMKLPGCLALVAMAVGISVIVSTGDSWLIAILAPIPFWVAAAALTYNTVAGLFNTTLIEVSDGRITVEHAPIRWWSEPAVAVDHIGRLYCDGTPSWSQKRGQVYDLRAEFESFEEVDLLRKVFEDEARYVRQRIEAHLADAERPGASG